MKTSEKITTIAPALVKAQALVASAIKVATNPHFKSRYADLASVIDACKSALNSCGIAFLQPVRASERGVIVETVLLHACGEWVSEELELPVSKADAQGVGSAITYGRRYGLQSLVGVPAEDDDGNAATTAAPAFKPQAAKQEAVDTLAGLDLDTQKFLHAEAVKIIDMHTAGKTIGDYVAGAHYDTEERLGLWALLPSDVRSAIKRQMAEPKPAALAEQA